MELAQYAGANGAWFLVGLGYQQRKLLSQVEKVAVGAQRLDEATAVEEHKLVRIVRPLLFPPMRRRLIVG